MPILRNTRQTAAVGRRLENRRLQRRGRCSAADSVTAADPLRVVNGCTHLGRVPWGPVVTLWQTRHVGLPPPRDHRNGISVRATPIAQDQESPRLSRPTEPRSPNRHEPPGRQQSSTVPERGIGRIRARLQASALASVSRHCWPDTKNLDARAVRRHPPQIPAGLPVTPCPGLRRSAREATAGLPQSEGWTAASFEPSYPRPKPRDQEPPRGPLRCNIASSSTPILVPLYHSPPSFGEGALTIVSSPARFPLSDVRSASLATGSAFGLGLPPVDVTSAIRLTAYLHGPDGPTLRPMLRACSCVLFIRPSPDLIRTQRTRSLVQRVSTELEARTWRPSGTPARPRP